MIIWVKERFLILKSSLQQPTLLFIWGGLNVADFLLGRFLSTSIDSKIPRISTLMPWYFWVMGWLLLLLSAVLEYALKISKKPSASKPKTKLMLLEEFLENKCKELEKKVTDKSLTLKAINDWREQLLSGFQTACGDNGYARLEATYRFVVMNQNNADMERIAESLTKMVRNFKKKTTSSELIPSFEPDDLRKFEE